MSVDCERWLNELTHKYLEFIQRCALARCTQLNMVTQEFNKLSGPGITPERLKYFSALLSLANSDLELFIQSRTKK